MNEKLPLAEGSVESSARRSVRPRKLAHVVLRTRSNFEAMIAWYRTALDAEVIYESARIAFLTYDDEHHRIAITRDEALAERPHRAVGLDHVAFTYDGLSDLLANYVRLKQAGILPFCAVNHGPTSSLYYNDPDLNRIELQIDNFADMHDATALMQNQFDANPVGEEFDPDEWLARLDAGVPPEEIVRPTGKPTAPTVGLITRLRSS